MSLSRRSVAALPSLSIAVAAALAGPTAHAEDAAGTAAEAAAAKEGSERPVAENPEAYIVPEAWRKRARRLVDPGSSGLPGGLTLERVELGHRIEAHYTGETGRLVAWIAPARAAPDDAFWKGSSIAIGTVDTDLDDAARTRALEALAEMMEGREAGWNWLRQPPEADERRARTEQVRERARGAWRLAWLGRSDEAVEEAKQAVSEASSDLPTLLAAARAAHRAGNRERGRRMGQSAREVAGRAASSRRDAGGEAYARVRAAQASALALAGRVDTARRIARSVAEGEHAACEAAEAVRDLERAGERAAALELAREIPELDEECDEARALRVELLRRAGHPEKARRRGRELVDARPIALEVRVALARLEIAEGNPKAAVEPARIALARSGARHGSVPALAAAVAAGGTSEEKLAQWRLADSERVPEPGNAALKALSCFGREDWTCTADRLAEVRDGGVDEPAVRALRALALLRAGEREEAEAALETAWARSPYGAAHVAAEALRAEQRGDREATPIWRAYLEAYEHGPGPVALAEARERAGVESGRAAEPEERAEAPPDEAAPDDGPDDGPNDGPNDGTEAGGGMTLWPWLLGLGAIVLAVAIYASSGRRRGGDGEA